MKAYGCVVVHGVEYHNDEILKLDPAARYLVGIDWGYGGDLDFKECDIVVDEKSFHGKNALKEALLYAAK